MGTEIRSFPDLQTFTYFEKEASKDSDLLMLFSVYKILTYKEKAQNE